MIEAPGVRAVARSEVKDSLLRLGLLDRSRFEQTRAAGRPIRSGRGGAVSIALGPGPEDRAIIRHCRRAGPFGGLLGDRHFGSRRPFNELAVHESARSGGVPTPECLAALAWRDGLFFRADLIVRELADVIPLDEWLGRGPEPPAVRTVAAACADAFAKLAAANIYHPDLHAGNVLVQPGGDALRVAFIDFDRARQLRSLPAGLRDLMLFRFNRALAKRSLSPGPVGLLTKLRFCREVGAAEPGGDLRAFAARCRTHLRRHSWRY